MCVGVTLWFGCTGVVSVCRLRHYYIAKLGTTIFRPTLRKPSIFHVICVYEFRRILRINNDNFPKGICKSKCGVFCDVGTGYMNGI